MASISFRAIDVRNLPRLLAADLRRLGLTFLRLSRERIESEGLGSDGEPMRTHAKDPNAAGTYSQFWSDVRQWGNRPPKVFKNKKTGAKFVKFGTEKYKGERISTFKPIRTRRARPGSGGKRVDIRTLSFRGLMLTSRKVTKATSTFAQIEFTGPEKDKALGNEKRTPFAQPTPTEREDLRQMAKQIIKERIAANLAEARARKR